MKLSAIAALALTVRANEGGRPSWYDEYSMNLRRGGGGDRGSRGTFEATSTYNYDEYAITVAPDMEKGEFEMRHDEMYYSDPYAPHGRQEPDLEELLRELERGVQEVQRALEEHPEDFLDSIHRDIKRGLDDGVEGVAMTLLHAQTELENWWSNVGRYSMNLQEYGCVEYFKEGHEGDYVSGTFGGGPYSDVCAVPYNSDGSIDWTGFNEAYGISGLLLHEECAYYHQDGYAGDFNYISWDGWRPDDQCAIPFNEDGTENWDAFNEWHSLVLLQKANLKIENLSEGLYSKWSKASAMNLSKVTAAQVMQTQKQNILNLHNLLVKSGATISLNSGSSLNLAECEDTNNGQVDAYGDSCSWYYNRQDACGLHDTEYFFANTMCCACSGGSEIETPPCYDTNNGLTDSQGETCFYYKERPDQCEFPSRNTELFINTEMCCGCGGGTSNSEDICHDTDNGVTDRSGDGCGWYATNPSTCGHYDTDYFLAGRLCCACGGGSKPAQNDTVCMDSNNGTTDSTGDTCSWYIGRDYACGSYDTETFTASTMCCGCGGGVDQEDVDAVMEDFAEGLGDLLDVNGDDGIPIEEEIARLDPTHVPVEPTEDSYCYNDGPIPWCEINGLVDQLNWIGRDPKSFLDNTREGLVAELRRTVDDIDQGLTEVKREIIQSINNENNGYMNLNEQEDAHAVVNARLAEIAEAMGGENLNEQDDAHAVVNARLAEITEAMGGGLNLAEEVLAAPEWEISLDEAAGEEMVNELTNEYEEWLQRFEHIMEDWKTDEELINKYYWEYEMEPHLEKGAKLDEKVLRSVVEYIANSTTVKGRPMVEVFPGVQEAMMSNFDPNGPNIYEKFGMMNLQEVGEEWFGADWYAYEACVAEAEFDVEAAKYGCEFYDTYESDFENCVVNYDCTGYDKFMEKYPTGRVEETSTIYFDGEHGSVEDQVHDYEHDLINEITQIEHAVEDKITPRGPVTYSLYFDEEAVNAWIDKEFQMFGTLNRMYSSAMEDYMGALAAVSEDHAPKFAELDELFKAQVDDTLFDINHFFYDNFSMEYAEEVSALSLAAKIENRHAQSQISNTDILMYAGVAVASFVISAWKFSQIAFKKREMAVNNNDVFERLI